MSRVPLTLTSSGPVVVPVYYVAAVIHRTLAELQKTLLSGGVRPVPVDAAARTVALTR